MASSQSPINPQSQIRWPLITGTADPATPAQPCTSVNFGQPYTNVTSGTMFVCASAGWVSTGGGGGGNFVQLNPTTSQTILEPDGTTLVVLPNDGSSTSDVFDVQSGAQTAGVVGPATNTPGQVFSTWGFSAGAEGVGPENSFCTSWQFFPNSSIACLMGATTGSSSQLTLGNNVDGNGNIFNAGSAASLTLTLGAGGSGAAPSFADINTSATVDAAPTSVFHFSNALNTSFAPLRLANLTDSNPALCEFGGSITNIGCTGGGWLETAGTTSTNDAVSLGGEGLGIVQPAGSLCQFLTNVPVDQTTDFCTYIDASGTVTLGDNVLNGTIPEPGQGSASLTMLTGPGDFPSQIIFNVSSTPNTIPTPVVTLDSNGLQLTSLTTAPSTNPVCPNGPNAELTTVGCAGGGGGLAP